MSRNDGCLRGQHPAEDRTEQSQAVRYKTHNLDLRWHVATIFLTLALIQQSSTRDHKAVERKQRTQGEKIYIRRLRMCVQHGRNHEQWETCSSRHGSHVRLEAHKKKEHKNSVASDNSRMSGIICVHWEKM